jgi:hypothetical protein
VSGEAVPLVDLRAQGQTPAATTAAASVVYLSPWGDADSPGTTRLGIRHVTIDREYALKPARLISIALDGKHYAARKDQIRLS